NSLCFCCLPCSYLCSEHTDLFPSQLYPYYPSSPSLSTAMQNQALREASYSSPLQRPVSPYDQPMNQVLRDASFVSPLQRPVSPHEQLMAPDASYASPLQRPMSPYEQPNQALRDASYASPLQRSLSPNAPSVPSSPMLSELFRIRTSSQLHILSLTAPS
uniref:Uncharacterized protein n=1 Tax=Cynoglossus semilaevis TaxID=244447 RepID=A0A3P8UJY9_CYNSE